MDFSREHLFTHGRADVEDAMGDPSFYAQLTIPDVTAPETLGRTYADGVITMEMRYIFTGQLDPIVRRVLGDSEISWTQTLVVDTGSHEGTLSIVPSVLPDKVDCHATVAFVDTDTGCTRTIAGDLKVGIPLLGSRAEKAILPGIARRLDLEAEALDAWLTAEQS